EENINAKASGATVEPAVLARDNAASRKEETGSVSTVPVAARVHPQHDNDDDTPTRVLFRAADAEQAGESSCSASATGSAATSCTTMEKNQEIIPRPAASHDTAPPPGGEEKFQVSSFAEWVRQQEEMEKKAENDSSDPFAVPKYESPQSKLHRRPYVFTLKRDRSEARRSVSSCKNLQKNDSGCSTSGTRGQHLVDAANGDGPRGRQRTATGGQS
ncbi:unnamed protein product, partial [Amoebophrya sp. A120]